LSKKRIIRDSIFNENVVNTSFSNPSTSTVYRLGEFTLDTNLDDRVIGDFTNKISSFSKEYTLETIGIDTIISQKIYETGNKLKINVDYNNIRSYSRYGSVEDLFKYTIKNIVEKFPYSIYLTSELNTGNINSITNFQYDEINNTSTFNIPVISIINKGNLIIDSTNFVENDIKNFNISKTKYVIWDFENPDTEYPIIDFSGNINTDSFITITAAGRVFDLTNSTLSKNFHIKPNKDEYNRIIYEFNDIEKYFLSNKTNEGFKFKLKVLNERAIDRFNNKSILWPTTDGYNIDYEDVIYNNFVNDLIKIGILYDEYKTDLIYRMYLPQSIKEFDLTSDSKLKKLIRTYGYNFDNIRKLIDGFATLNNLTYKKEGSIPDILVKNLAKVLGWNVNDILTEDDLMSKIFTTKTQDISNSLLPSEINIELWKRILINTKWFFKSKGTRKSIETIFKLIGIPEDFINLNEYVYLADKELNENERIDSTRTNVLGNVVVNDPSYDTNGYPIAPQENNQYYFQVSGNTDSGQTYINRFRENGFNIKTQEDNKKSWVYVENYHIRTDENSIYSSNDSRLVINTKEIDLGIDPSKALLFDIFRFNKSNNYPVCSNGISLSVLYLNVLSNPDQLNVFEIPDVPDGDIQVILNGIVLVENTDYTVTGVDNNIIEITKSGFNYINDVVTVTYVVNNTTNQVDYNIFKPTITSNGQTIITLPVEPSGDIQLVLNGYTLVNGKDFYINPNNRTQLILTNVNILTTDILSVMYINELSGLNTIKYSDNYTVSNYYNDKLFYNNYNNRYVFVSDYIIPNSANVKVILNGRTLVNNSDFTVNQSNKKQIIFDKKIKININDEINVFYLLNNSENQDCINLGIDINNIEFFEYVDKVYKNLINVRNRKIITNNRGGEYPTLSKIYDLYVKYNQNNRTYNGLYSFVKNFDNHFISFVDQLLPATTILRKSGLIVNNSILSKQKYKFIRGINDGAEYLSESLVYSCDLFGISGVTKTPATTSQDLGSVTFTVTGDNTTVGPTEFSINNLIWEEGITTSGVTEYTLTGLTYGEYEMSIRDGINCQLLEPFEIEKDCTLLEITEINTTDKISSTLLGSIEIVATGDTNITYSIDGGLNYFTNNTFTGLDIGDYDIYVKNSIDCIVTGTTSISGVCDITITDIEVINCTPNGYESRLDSGLIYENNTLSVFLNYDFTIDNNFNKYVRDKITITETTTNEVILEKWIEFDVETGQDTIELGIVWEYENVPTYSNFNFEIAYLSEPEISCEPFTTPLPAEVFNPIPEQPQLQVVAVNALTGPCGIGGEDDVYIGASVELNVATPSRIEVGVDVKYLVDGDTNCSNPGIFQTVYFAIEAGEKIGELNECDGLYVENLSQVCDNGTCISYISDSNVDLNGFGCP